MLRRPTKEINAEFPAEEKYLDSIQKIVREACSAAGMIRKEVSAVLLAIEEGSTNIIRHAYLYDSGSIRLRIVIYPKFVSFSLIDFGRSFRPDGVGKLDLERLVESGRRGGLGFYMIQKIMDSVEYVSWAGQNELRMTKRLGKEDPNSTPPLLRRMFTLRMKFSLWTFFIVSMIIASAFYYINDRTSKEIYLYLDGTVQALTQAIAEQAGPYILNNRSDVEFDELVVSFPNSSPAINRVVITDSLNMILAHSDDINNIRKQYLYPPYAEPGLMNVPQRQEQAGGEVNYLAIPIMSGGTRLGAVHVIYTSQPILSRLEESRQKILQFTFVLVLIGIIGIYLLSNYFVKPIASITRRVRRFSSGDLESELPLEGAAEFFEISNALNEMMTRLRRDRETVVEREKLAKEVEVASQIQKTLLPHQLPELPGLEIEAFYRAASVIGGDLYDLFKIDDHRCGLVVADVSGKGVPASLVMSMLRTVIQIHSQKAVTARSTLIQVNDYLAHNIPKGMFITVLMGIYDATTRKLSFVSAGHNPLIVYRARTGQVLKVNPTGLPLGVPLTLDRSFEETIEEAVIELETGDTFFMYTDGITEATNREGSQFGLSRLMEYVKERWDRGSDDELSGLSADIIREIDSFANFATQRDDITYILGRVGEHKEPVASKPEPVRDEIDTQTLPDRAPGSGDS